MEGKIILYHAEISDNFGISKRDTEAIGTGEKEMIRTLASWTLRLFASVVGVLMVWQIYIGNSDLAPNATATGHPSDNPTQLAAYVPDETQSPASPPATSPVEPTDVAELSVDPVNPVIANNAVPTNPKPSPRRPIQSRSWNKASSDTQNPHAVEVIHAQSLAIRFQGYKDLSGDYRLHSDNTITIPVLGRINVAGMYPADLERQLSHRVREMTGRQAHVTVEVGAYIPVLINGYVTSPGSTPWTPGMTVLHAETLAGGILRPGARSGDIDPTDKQFTAIKRQGSELERVLATLARLRAERKGANSIDPDRALIKLAGKAQAELLLKAQTSALVSRNHAVSTQLKTIDQAIELAQKEVAALTEQSSRIDYQLKVRSDLLAKLGNLRKRGHIHNDRYLNEQAKVAELEERRANVSVAIAKVGSEQIKLRREAVKLKLERRAKLDTLILDLEREAAQLKIELDAARAAYRKLSGRNVQSIRERDKPKIITYEIVRKTSTGLKRIAATQETQLRPGDIIIVNTSDS